MSYTEKDINATKVIIPQGHLSALDPTAAEESLSEIPNFDEVHYAHTTPVNLKSAVKYPVDARVGGQTFVKEVEAAVADVDGDIGSVGAFENPTEVLGANENVGAGEVS